MLELNNTNIKLETITIIVTYKFTIYKHIKKKITVTIISIKKTINPTTYFIKQIQIYKILLPNYKHTKKIQLQLQTSRKRITLLPIIIFYQTITNLQNHIIFIKWKKSRTLKITFKTSNMENKPRKIM